ncbi:ClpP/crotonase-like domain-containing protein [Hyaloraphidium curvatum]|nr:ClpP/crotonase-like domain-containing protein [Hyaloraphidium curvatum]
MELADAAVGDKPLIGGLDTREWLCILPAPVVLRAEVGERAPEDPAADARAADPLGPAAVLDAASSDALLLFLTHALVAHFRAMVDAGTESAATDAETQYAELLPFLACRWRQDNVLPQSAALSVVIIVTELTAIIVYVTTGSCIPIYAVLFGAFGLVILGVALTNAVVGNARITQTSALLRSAALSLRRLIVAAEAAQPPTPASDRLARRIASHVAVLSELAEVRGAEARLLGAPVTGGLARRLLAGTLTACFAAWTVLRATGVTVTIQNQPPLPPIGRAPAYFKNLREHFRTMGGGRVHFSVPEKGVALIELDNPKKANAFDGRMAAEVADAVDRLEALLGITRGDKILDEKEDQALEKAKSEGKDLVAVIVAGRGKNFSGGFDFDTSGRSQATGRQMNLLMADSLYRLKSLPIISVAAVNGVAIGGGAEFTTACDWRVMASDAQIKFFTMKMSVATVWGAGTYLPRIVPPIQALRLISSTLPNRAADAFAVGLAQHVAPPGQDAVKAALAFLHPVIFFDSPKETARHTVDAVREIKACMLRANGGEEAMRGELEKEMAVVARLWGAPANWAAVQRRGKAPTAKL